MEISEASSLILAVGSVVTIITTVWLNRRGQDNEKREQDAATTLAARKQQFDEANTAVTLAREDADRERARADRAETRAETVQSRCDDAQRDARDALVAMRTVLLDEVARAAGDAAVRDITDHLHDDEESP